MAKTSLHTHTAVARLTSFLVQYDTRVCEMPARSLTLDVAWNSAGRLMKYSPILGEHVAVSGRRLWYTTEP